MISSFDLETMIGDLGAEKGNVDRINAFVRGKNMGQIRTGSLSEAKKRIFEDLEIPTKNQENGQHRTTPRFAQKETDRRYHRLQFDKINYQVVIMDMNFQSLLNPHVEYLEWSKNYLNMILGYYPGY